MTLNLIISVLINVLVIQFLGVKQYLRGGKRMEAEVVCELQFFMDIMQSNIVDGDEVDGSCMQFRSWTRIENVHY